jgi:hypothetical protein
VSNVRQEPDWWLGSDGRWYPPPVPSGVAAAATRCPNGHSTSAGARFCGVCGEPATAASTAYVGARRTATATQPQTPVAMDSQSHHVPTPQPVGASGSAVAQPPVVVVQPRPVTKSPLAYLVSMGAVVLGVAPLLTWYSGQVDAGSLGSYSLGNSNLFQLGANAGTSTHNTVLIAVAAYTVVALAFVLPLTPLRATVSGALTMVLGIAGAAVAVPFAVQFYRQAGISSLPVGPYVAGAGFLVIIVGSLLYVIDGRARAARTEALRSM